MGIIGICVRVTALLVLVMATSTTGWAQSLLPPCPADQNVYWTNCVGTLTFANGDKYVGEWRDNKLHGQGTETYGPQSQWAGDKYVGEHRDDKKHGQGTFIFSDGRKYVGEWRGDKRNGQGTEYLANGSVGQSGLWREDQLVGTSMTQPSQTNSAAPVRDLQSEQTTSVRFPIFLFDWMSGLGGIPWIVGSIFVALQIIPIALVLLIKIPPANHFGPIPASRSFFDAITVCLKKYAVFKGRSSRSEFWYFMLFYSGVYLVFHFLEKLISDSISGYIVAISIILLFVLSIPCLAVLVRRLHDRNRSGWWLWLSALVFSFAGSIILFIWMCRGPIDEKTGVVSPSLNDDLIP